MELESPQALVGKVNQELQTLERFRSRLDADEAMLTRLEVADRVTVRAALNLLQRAELVRRIGEQIEADAVGLGGEGGMVDLQHMDLVQGTSQLRELVIRDYVKGGKRKASLAMRRLEETETKDLYDIERLASALNLDHPDTAVRPNGYRLLSKVPRLPITVQDSLVRHFRDFQKMLVASVDELDEVSGVGGARAMDLRRYFDRLGEVAAHSSFDGL